MATFNYLCTVAASPDISIIFEDRYLVVVNKPHGLQCEPDKNGHPDLCTLLRRQLNRENRPPKLLQPVNRLDRPVGGLVLFAKTPTLLRELNAQQEARRIEKIYQAKVQGTLQPPQGVLEHYLYKDLLNKKAVIYTEPQAEAKRCVLEYDTVEQNSGCSRLQIRLRTGRYHQIRAQLAFVGHPIWGDAFYGAVEPFREQAIALFASRLGFTHPVTGLRLVFEAVPSF